MTTQTRRTVSIRRSILSNMLLLVALFAVAMLLSTVIGANRVASSLSKTLIEQTLTQTEGRVRSFIAPVENALSLVTAWTVAGHFDLESGTGAEELLVPVLTEFDQLYGAMVIGPDGGGMTVARADSGWRLVLVDNDPETDETPFRILPGAGSPNDADADGDAKWQTVVYPFYPPDRPWYQGAVESDAATTYWTTAYKFFMSGQPGITASRAIVVDGETWVVAFDVLLEDISDFTRHIDIGHNGLVLVTDDAAQIIGLPNLPRFDHDETRESAYLKRAEELGFDLANDAANAFLKGGDTAVGDPVRFFSGNEHWWGQGRWIALNNSREIWAGVIVPEAELLGSIGRLRWVIVAVALVLTAIAVYRAFVLAARYGGPVRELATHSLKYAAGNLDPVEPIRSHLKEILQLADAHDRMRVGLTNLLKLEDDLQLARQIQQKTFPTTFPTTNRFDISAASRPADATGGDTFDVIGVREQSGIFTLVESRPNRIFCILADATGHGIGPALTASQVRAMFRMGVRLGNPLGRICCEMNDQLSADSHGGRFVTALLAQVDVEEGEVQMLSAGQAPILIYSRGDDRFEELGADAPPLGVLPSPPDPPQARVVRLDRGDILAIVSDGVFEARSASGERFGQPRVEALIREGREGSMRALMQRLKSDIDRFADGQPVEDDQTAIFVKRV